MKKALEILKNRFGLLLLIILVLKLNFSSCTANELEIQQSFPFKVIIMPMAKSISNGETIEIRIKIVPSGGFIFTTYFLRYFQYDGTGILQSSDGLQFSPNDSYTLAHNNFNLYYTSTSRIAQTFDIWIYDNFGNEQQIKFQLKNKD